MLEIIGWIKLIVLPSPWSRILCVKGNIPEQPSIKKRTTRNRRNCFVSNHGNIEHAIGIRPANDVKVI